ncbi:MAG: polysaccharide biosynthesis C-terminal domain-containing protein [Bacteroidales bacterium]|nr:polysaccharide biosynthesis C-terminal domain-containing protein [Bacteroidales bacterium]
MLLILANKLRKDGHWVLNNAKFNVTAQQKKEIITVGFFGLLVGFCVSANLHLDKIFVGSLLSISELGVYSTAFIYGSLIVVPSRAINKISSIYISEAWKDNDLVTIQRLYRKTSLNLFIIGMFLFMMLWLNIDFVFYYLPEHFRLGKWSIFFIALSGLFEMGGGALSSVLYSSPDYKYQALANILYLVLIFLFSYLFIPIWGITGAGVAVFISMFIYQALRMLFVYKRYKMQPLEKKHLYVILFSLFIFVLLYLIPDTEYVIVSVVINSIVISISYLFGFVNLFRFNDLYELIQKYVPLSIFELKKSIK